MSQKLLPVTKDGQFIYNILICSDFSSLAKNTAALGIEGHRMCIVTDSNVEKLYAEHVKALLAPIFREVCIYVLPAGEENKNLNQIRGIYRFLISKNFDRQDMLAALGGGVCGDMTGFAAATYLRGIRFIQIPTTLLSQVDSSIGGKTGVDFEEFKNMVGAFYMPSLVYINTRTLLSLDSLQFASGMGEIVKHGLIRDQKYFDFLLSHRDEIEKREPAVLEKVVEGSCLIKRSVVEKDPAEKGERALLNFGHTIGHAVEKLKNFTLPHGWCVALGCIAAAWISFRRGLISKEDFERIEDSMEMFHLPVSLEGLRPDDVLSATKHDKKMAAGKIKFILLKSIGNAYIDLTVTDEEILDAVRFLEGTGPLEGRNSR